MGPLGALLRLQPTACYAAAMGTELQRKRWSWGPEGACNTSQVRDAYIQDGKLKKTARDAMRKECAACPVLRNCRAWAIVHSTQYFIAGMMPYELASIRKNEINKWGYEAYKWGWLEDDNLLTVEQLARFAVQLKAERYRQKHPAPPVPEVYEVFSVEPFVL